MEPSIQLIIICCNEERRSFQEKQMETLGLSYAIFDGYTPSNSIDYITEKHPKYPERDNVICCLRSHIGAIDYFAKHYSHKDYCIIVEDDVILRESGLGSSSPDNWNFFKRYHVLNSKFKTYNGQVINNPDSFTLEDHFKLFSIL